MKPRFLKRAERTNKSLLVELDPALLADYFVFLPFPKERGLIRRRPAFQKPRATTYVAYCASSISRLLIKGG